MQCYSAPGPFSPSNPCKYSGQYGRENRFSSEGVTGLLFLISASDCTSRRDGSGNKVQLSGRLTTDDRKEKGEAGSGVASDFLGEMQSYLQEKKIL